MARIRPLNIDEVNDEAKDIFDQFMQHRGNVPNMFRTLAYRPELLESAYKHFNLVLNKGIVDIRLKEMVAVKVSTLNDCDY